MTRDQSGLVLLSIGQQISREAVGHISRLLNLTHRDTATNHKIQPIFGLMGGKWHYY